MYSLGSQAKRPHEEDSDDGTHPQEPVHHSIRDRGIMSTNSTGVAAAAAIAASYARKSKSQVTTQLDYEEEEEVEDYFEENQEYTSPHMTYRNEKFRSSVPGASAVGVFAVQGPGIDEESQVYVSTVNENTNQGSEDLGCMNTGNMMLDASRGQEPIEAHRVSDGKEMHDQAKVIAEMVHRELMAYAQSVESKELVGNFSGPHAYSSSSDDQQCSLQLSTQAHGRGAMLSGNVIVPVHLESLFNSDQVACLLTDPGMVMDISFLREQIPGPDEQIRSTRVVPCASGMAHGVLFWWELNLWGDISYSTQQGKEPWGDISYSTQQGKEPWQDHWLATVPFRFRRRT